MEMKGFYWALITCLCLAILAVPINGNAASKVKFVKKVSKSCNHLGNKTYTMDKDKIFPSWSSVSSVEAGAAFANDVKKDVVKLGGNRVVIADVFHDITSYYGRHRSRVIDASYIEVQIFRCGK